MDVQLSITNHKPHHGCSLGLEHLGLEMVSRRFCEHLGLVSLQRLCFFSVSRLKRLRSVLVSASYRHYRKTAFQISKLKLGLNYCSSLSSVYLFYFFVLPSWRINVADTTWHVC